MWRDFSEKPPETRMELNRAVPKKTQKDPRFLNIKKNTKQYKSSLDTQHNGVRWSWLKDPIFGFKLFSLLLSTH